MVSEFWVHGHLGGQSWAFKVGSCTPLVLTAPKAHQLAAQISVVNSGRVSHSTAQPI